MVSYKSTRVQSLFELDPGDHVRKDHGLYWHHMLVVKVLDETRVRVIHYTSRSGTPHNRYPESLQTSSVVGLGSAQCSGSGSVVSELAEVLEEEVVLDPSEEEIDLIEYDMTCTIHQGMNAIKRARSKIGERNFNLFSNNCESFVNWIKIDKATSKQGKDAAVAVVVAAILVGIVGAIVVGVLLSRSSKSSKQERH